MRSNLVKIACMLMSLSITFTACAKNEPVSDNTQENKTATETTQNNKTIGASTVDYTLPIVKDGSVTLTIGAYDNYYAAASYTQNLPIWKAIEEKTGVKVKWDVVASSQYSQMMTVRLASMTNIPDLFTIPGDPVKLGADGVLEPMEKLIEQYAPNMKKYFSENPEIYKILRAPDGHIYFITSVVTGTNLSDPMGWLIRKDWLDKLKLKEPETIDDWYNVLKAFKERDPNGNGKPDEQPLAFADFSTVKVFGNAWGLHLYGSGGFSPNNDNKLQYEWFDNRSKELMIWVSKLYKEGILDPDFLTTKVDQLNSKVSKDLVGATYAFISQIDAYDKKLKSAGVTDANWIAVAPPKGPNGYKGHTEKNGVTSGGRFGMSSKCKNKEVAIKWLDYVYASEEGNRFVTFGIEGKSYVMENGEPKFTDWAIKNPDGLDLTSALRSLGAFPTLPWIRNDKGPLSKQPAATIAHLPKTQESAKKIASSLINPYPSMLPTPEESSALKPLMADLHTKINEKMANFITGSEDINKNWDLFLKELKSIGIDEILKLQQQQYDRYLK